MTTEDTVGWLVLVLLLVVVLGAWLWARRRR